MQLESPPFWILPFNTRSVGIALHDLRGIVLLDPAGQRDLPVDRVRLYVAKDNLLYILYENQTKGYLSLPKNEKQAWLGIHAYRAFINPKLPRPSQFKPLPSDESYWDQLDDVVPVPSDPHCND